MAKLENKDDPNTWPKLYSAADARRQDAWRTTSFALVFILTLSFVFGYLIVYTYFFPNQYPDQGGLGFTGFFGWLMKNLGVYIIVLIFTISAGLGLMFHVVGNFFKALHTPPEGAQLLKQIFIRLFGMPLPPLPPPFSQVMIGQYPIVLIDIADVDVKKFVLKTQPSYWLGGPALLVVIDGTGVYLQRGDRFSRTLGPGIHFLERFETLRDIVDLRAQTMRSGQGGTPPPITGRTKDGIKIEFNLEISFRVLPASYIKTGHENVARTKAEREAQEKYLSTAPVNSGDLEAIRKAVESTCTRRRTPTEYSQAKWQDGVWGAVSGELAKYVTKHYIDDLIVFENKEDGWARAHQVGASSKMAAGEDTILASKAGQLLSESQRIELRLDLDASLRQAKGVILTDLRITGVELPPEVSEQRLKLLEVESLKQRKRSEGDARAKQIRIKEHSRTQAQQNLIANLAASLSEVDPDNFADAVMMTVSNILSQGKEDSLDSTLFAKDTFDILEQLREFLHGEKTP
jgi:regulator of protease activity HflC (stomatin/prohibitin superfamily)